MPASTPVGIGHGRVLVGLAGRGILQSRTPWMHEQESAAQDLRLVYSLFDFTDRGWDDAELPRLIDAAHRLGFAGLNVTYPFKQDVIGYLDGLSDGAAGVGAVNTISFRDGQRIGHNTDVTGFARSLEQGLGEAARGCVLQIGCGGAGSATAQALLADFGAGQLLLADNDPDRADALAEKLAARFGADRITVVRDPSAAAAQADGIVNATPMGMAKFPGTPVHADALDARHWVADIVYFPLETELLAAARRKGCRLLDGSGMAVWQAVHAFEIFTGRSANLDRMKASFISHAEQTSVPAE